MELKPTNTPTATTVAPPGWSYKPIGQIGPLQRGFDLPNRDIRPGSIPIVYSNGADGFHCRAMAQGPGVVTGRSGTIGKVHFIESAFWPHNTSLWVTRFNGNDPKFVFYLYDFIGFDRFASGSGVPTLNRNDVHSFDVAIPDSPVEQQAIARALTDVDALLTGLDRLIAKKRDLKQAAMQQLLTGQTRLPGFQGEWEMRSLGSLGAWRGGMTPSMANPAYWEGGEVPWISSGDVKVTRLSDTSQHVTSLAVREGAAVMVPAGAVVVVTRSGILRKYLPVAALVQPMAINQDIKALVPDKSVFSDFALHAMQGYGERILATCLKAGTTVESIEFPWLKAFPIPLPPLEEQAEIAAVLSDMDAELAALEARRDKTRALKQGMMQELLTGRTRLVRPEAEEAAAC